MYRIEGRWQTQVGYGALMLTFSHRHTGVTLHASRTPPPTPPGKGPKALLGIFKKWIKSGMDRENMRLWLSFQIF